MKTGSYYAKKPFGLGMFFILGSNAEIVYIEK